MKPKKKKGGRPKSKDKKNIAINLYARPSQIKHHDGIETLKGKLYSVIEGKVILEFLSRPIEKAKAI